jgi:hypothetical protein
MSLFKLALSRPALAAGRRPRIGPAAGALLGAALLAGAPANAATQAELEARVEVLSSQLEAMQSELARLKAQVQLSSSITALEPELPPEAAPPAPAETTATNEPPAAPAAGTTGFETTGPYAADDAGVSWFGYGELNHSRQSEDHSETTADVGRFVIGAGYRFDDRTRFASEIEIEHAIASANDEGEVEIEQAYIEHAIGSSVFAKAGLVLIPSGLLNEYHEPTRYYGVFRNFVETRIIPTTWREGGVTLQGNTEGGLRWDVGVTTGFNLAKWDQQDEEGLEEALGAIHQEMSLAKASDLSTFGALNWTGVPGLLVGGSVFTGNSGQDQPGLGDHRITLTEAHGRWSPGNWDLSALYALGRIDDSLDANLALSGGSTDFGVSPVPEEFFGWYLEGAYRYMGSRYGIAPFVRYERWNTASEYESPATAPALVTPDDLEAWTAGFNFTLAPGVVIKADYVGFVDGDEGDRADLSLGYAF